MIAFCGFLENEISQFSKEEGVTLADCVETFGVDLRTRVKSLGAKEKARRKKCKVRFLDYQEELGLPAELHESGCQEVAVCRHDASKDLGAHAVGMSPTERLKLRRQMAAAAGKKSTTSLSLFMEAHVLEVEDEISTMAHSVLGRRSIDRKMESRAERSLDEADSRGANMETGKRTRRSSDV